MAAMLLLPVAVMALVGSGTLALNPTHGQAGAAFSATYNHSPCKTPAGTAVDIYWNDYPPNGGKLLGSTVTDANCTARASVAAPAGAKPAAYPVYAFIPAAGGVPTTGTLATATFTIDATPASPSPSTGASASAKPSAGSAPGPMAAAGGLFGPIPLGWLLVAGLALLVVLLVWRRRSAQSSQGSDRRAA